MNEEQKNMTSNNVFDNNAGEKVSTSKQRAANDYGKDEEISSAAAEHSSTNGELLLQEEQPPSLEARELKSEQFKTTKEGTTVVSTLKFDNSNEKQNCYSGDKRKNPPTTDNNLNTSCSTSTPTEQEKITFYHGTHIPHGGYFHRSSLHHHYLDTAGTPLNGLTGENQNDHQVQNTSYGEEYFQRSPFHSHDERTSDGYDVKMKGSNSNARKLAKNDDKDRQQEDEKS